jgi:hypothetical protein
MASRPPNTPKIAPDAPALVMNGCHRRLATDAPMPLRRYSTRYEPFP